MEISVIPSFEYGNVRYYPANELANSLLIISKRKSFTKAKLLILKGAGFKVTVKDPKQKSMYSLEGTL